MFDWSIRKRRNLNQIKINKQTILKSCPFLWLCWCFNCVALDCIVLYCVGALAFSCVGVYAVGVLIAILRLVSLFFSGHFFHDFIFSSVRGLSSSVNTFEGFINNGIKNMGNFFQKKRKIEIK